MATNEILPFAQGGGANVQSQIDYAAEPLRSSGNVAGIARSNVNNKALRQASVLAAGLAQFMADNQSNNIVDTASIANLANWLGDAIRAANNAAASVGSSVNSAMYVASPSVSASYTCDELIVGLSLGGRQWRLTGINKSINLSAVGAGGMDAGLAPIAGFVALYVIFNPTTLDVAMLATDATSVTAGEVYGGANMPAGYTYSALVSVVPTTAARLMGAHTLVGRSVGFDQVNVISTATQRASPFAFSVASTVPRNAKSVSGSMSVSSTSTASASVISLSASAGGLGRRLVTVFGGNGVGAPFSDMPCTYPGGSLSTVFYTATVTTGTMDADVNISEYKF